MKKNIDEVIEQYEESGKIMYEGTLSGDYKKNNRENAKLVAIFKEFEKDREFAEECIEQLLKSSNVVVQTEAAAYCLALGINVAKAEKMLKKISKDKKNGMFGFIAKMTLKEWEKDGELTIYQKKK